jgi:diacylglycerol O-acyltransferase / wax synthase
LSWTPLNDAWCYTFDRLRGELAIRRAAIPEFRAKLADSQLNLDYPVWVDDDAFDRNHHLDRIVLPSPGGRRKLAEVCGHIASVPLDRSRPLWEMWVIEASLSAARICREPRGHR